MSSEKRCFSFILAALSIVLIERAVRPCFPITLPTSLAATRKRRTVPSPSLMASTETSPGLSTRARAISATRIVMLLAGSSPAEYCMASVITYTFYDSGNHGRRPTLVPFVPSCRGILQEQNETSETPLHGQRMEIHTLPLCIARAEPA